MYAATPDTWELCKTIRSLGVRGSTEDKQVLVRVTLNADTAAEERMPLRSSMASVKAMFQWHMAVRRSRWPVVSSLRNTPTAELALADTLTLDALTGPDTPASLDVHVVGDAYVLVAAFSA